MKIRITGIGAVGGFGCGISALEQALVSGKPSDRIIPLDTVNGRIQVPALLADTAILNDRVDKRTLRRIDPHTRKALLASLLALEDAGISSQEVKNDLGILVGTGYGSTCNTFDFQELALEKDIRRFSPIQFSNSVHNAAGAHIATILQSSGPNLSVNQYDISFSAALMTACHWLVEGRVKQVLAGGVDDFSRMMAYHRHCVTENGDSRSGGGPTAIGEGSIFFLLSADADTDSGYGCIQDVRNGIYNGSYPLLPDHAVFFAGADGLSPEESRYTSWIGNKGPVAVYSSLYGNLPVGTGFDLAIAALSIRNRRIYACAGEPVLQNEQTAILRKSQPLDGRRICCVKIGATAGCGMITLSENADEYGKGR